DPRGQKEMMNMCDDMHKKQKLTRVLVTHSMEDAMKYADHVLILNKGTKYMEGKPEDVFTRQDALHDVQLDVPEMVQFMNNYNQRFNTSIPFTRQSIEELAEQTQTSLEGVGKNEYLFNYRSVCSW